MSQEDYRDDVATNEEPDEITEVRQITAKARELFFQAEELNFASQEEGSLKLYSRVVEISADSLYGRLASGQIAVLSGPRALQTALNEFLQALEYENQLLSAGIIEQPEDSIRINLGLTYRKLRMFEEALETFHSINPETRVDKCAFAYAGLSTVYRYMSEHSDDAEQKKELYLLAVNAAKQALDLDPALTYARTSLISLYDAESQGDPAKAELASTMAREVLEQEPNNWYLLGTLAKMYRKSDPKKALEYYEQAVKHSPRREIYSRFGYATLLKSTYQDDLEKPKTLLEQVLEVNPDHTGALAQLADIHLRESDFEHARVLASRSIELTVGQPLKYQLLARVTLARVEFAEEHFSAANEAIEPFRNIEDKEIKWDSKLKSLLKKLKEEQGKVPGYEKEAERAFRAGNCKEAYDLILRIIDLNPREFRMYGRAAICCLETGHWKQAIDIAQRALKVGESMGYSEKSIAEAYAGQGRIEDAVVTYRLALEKNSSRSTGGFRSEDKRWIVAEIERLVTELRRQVKTKKLNLGQRQQMTAAGPYFVFRNTTTRETETHSTELITQFLSYVLKSQDLPIGKIGPDDSSSPIDQIGGEPVFLIAKTGVGKTVAVPTKVLISHFEAFFAKKGTNRNEELKVFPQVYVVVPRIPIAQGMMNHMNSVYQSYLKSAGVKSVSNYNLFGSVSSAGKKNANAPILFVTTGIFESMAFNDQLDPDLHRVIIDEAHVTIEQNSGVEIGVCMAKKKGVVVDYMSATVKTDTLEEDLGVKIVQAGSVRFPILLKNLGGTVEDHLIQLVRDYMVEPKLELYPDRNDPVYGQITADLFDDRDRPHGMLVIVNSHQGANSDTQKYCKMIEQADFNRPERKVAVFSYASPIARDKTTEEQFRRQIAGVEARNGLYVIVATNVVEMGVTFDSMDYIVTMDSEFITTFVDDGQLLETTSLGVNALYQRIGRVGRCRGGMAFIALEYGADYAKLPDEQLRKSLPYQAIQFPIAKGNLAKLALMSYKEQWQDPESELLQLRLPSLRKNEAEVLARFAKARAKIEQLGLTAGARFNDIGARGLEYLSVESLDYKRLLALAEKRGQKELLKVILVAAAAADFGLNRFLQSGTRFTIKDDTGRKDHLTLDKYLLLQGKDLNVDEIGSTISGCRDEALSAQLLTLGVAAEDICLINYFIRDGHRLNGCVSEIENAEGDEDSGDGQAEKKQKGVGLYFSKTAVLSDPDSEVITIYNIVCYFYNRYQIDFSEPGISESRRRQIGDDMAKEVSELGLSPIVIRNILKNVDDLARQFSRNGSGKVLGETTTELVPLELQPKKEDKVSCLVACLLLQMHEVELDGFDYDLIEELATEIVEDRSLLSSNDHSRLSQLATHFMEKGGFAVGSREVDQIEQMLIRPAIRDFQEEISSLENRLIVDGLPYMTDHLRSQVISFIKSQKFGEEVTLKFSESNPFYKTWVGEAESETGERYPVLLRSTGTSLKLEDVAEMEVTVRGRLLPAYYTEMESEAKTMARGGKRLPSHMQKQQRIFELLHVTL